VTHVTDSLVAPPGYVVHQDPFTGRPLIHMAPDFASAQTDRIAGKGLAAAKGTTALMLVGAFVGYGVGIGATAAEIGYGAGFLNFLNVLVPKMQEGGPADVEPEIALAALGLTMPPMPQLPRVIGKGCDGVVLRLPNGLVKKIYHTPSKMGEALDGLDLLRDAVRTTGTKNIRVVETLEAGLDASGYAYSSHPHIAGTLLGKNAPEALRRQFIETARPVFEKAFEEAADLFLRLASRDGNVILEPDGIFTIIDAF